MTLQEVMSRLTDSVEYYLLKTECQELDVITASHVRIEHQRAFEYIGQGLFTVAEGYVNRAEALMH